MKKFFTTFAVLVVFATPSFAQSFCTCDGTGNVLMFTHNPITVPQNGTIAVGQGGLNSFAMAPGRGSAFNPNSPSATGGGSLGYNENLRNY